MDFLKYSTDVEKLSQDEPEIFAKITETFTQMAQHVKDKQGHAVRASHAKSTALLKGKLIVDQNLSKELAQGIFAEPANYDLVARFAQGPGEVLGDKVSTHRGMAIKILGVSGERIPEAKEKATQDWLTEARETAFVNANASGFLKNLKTGVSHAPSLSESVKVAISRMSLAINTAFESVGFSSKMLGLLGHSPVHPLSENYFSQVPIRWGEYIAKLGFYPTEETKNSLLQIKINNKNDFNAFRHAMMEHFAKKGAEFEFRVQLATNLHDMPIEDASKRWPEQKSPYRRVGRIVIEPQDAWNKERSNYVDERMSFQPANSLLAHRPLGQIMRARLFVYERLVAFRQLNNGVTKVEPNDTADLPMDR